ncbi:hypothetical protein [Rummeliibacillus pycnus]|uniref:hypothetical protein n=1 Tax=Rummeliibacillus pycnus TaxID=101070 RepID=UPI0037CB6AEE
MTKNKGIPARIKYERHLARLTLAELTTKYNEVVEQHATQEERVSESTMKRFENGTSETKMKQNTIFSYLFCVNLEEFIELNLPNTANFVTPFLKFIKEYQKSLKDN